MSVFFIPSSRHATRWVWAAILSSALLAATAAAVEAQGRCASCHLAHQNAVGPLWTGFSVRHLEDWDRSQHARSDVGCDRCHGGDPNTFERFPAHQNILASRYPASPVNRANLPRTCGTCHTGPFVAFQKSRHYQLLREGDERGPTCSTCHGEVAAYLLSPSSLEGQCARCHGAGKTHPRPDYPADAKLMMGGIRDVRAMLKDASSLIRRVKDKTARANFEEAYGQAEASLIEARNAGHEFVFDNLKERLNRARQRVDALMDALANRGQ